MRYDQIPGYRVERLVGKGGMASVYLAIQESLDRPVALKILRHPDSEEFSERFSNEGRIIASLTHPNIISVYDVGVSDGLRYISMEYVEGGDLKTRIADGVTPDCALELVSKIASCLEFAHKKGVIHRDLKPANILFRSDGTPLLTDFGIAKHQWLDSDLTATGIALGTPQYMSPEQAQAKSVDGRADVYSLGIILYEMLTGKTPYDGDSEVDTILRHLQDPMPVLPAEYRTYQTLLKRMLAKDPAQRFADAGELLEFLTTLRGVATQADARNVTRRKRPSLPHRVLTLVSGSWVGKHLSELTLTTRNVALCGGGSLVLLILGIGFLYRGGLPGESDGVASELVTTAQRVPPEGRGKSVDEPSASLTQTPDKLDPNALYQLGKVYRDRSSVRRDDKKAAELFYQAAQQGHAPAQYYLGVMNGQGHGVPQDLEQAVRWYEKAARQNIVDAQYLLCLSYALGRGVITDNVTAYAWCQIAHEGGSRDAQDTIVTITNLMSEDSIREAKSVAASIAQSLHERPAALLDTPSSDSRQDVATIENTAATVPNSEGGSNWKRMAAP